MNDEPVLSETAAALHKKILVWDNHVCIPRTTDTQWIKALDRHRQAGTDMLTLSISGYDGDGIETLTRMAAHCRHFIAENPNDYIQVKTTDDILLAMQSGKLGIAFNVESPGDIGNQLSLISLYYDLGVRWMIMAYNQPNLIAGGCQSLDKGLTAFGFRVIAEMDRVGMVKCCSHAGYNSAMDVLTHSELPVLFSHSNPRALRDHPRNITDELIDACAATDGVIGINGVGIFLGDNDISTDTLVRHIDYIVQRVGIGHVGLGLDYTYDTRDMSPREDLSKNLWPVSLGYGKAMRFATPEQLPEITEALLRLGYSEGDIRQVMGGNLLRVAEKVWK